MNFTILTHFIVAAVAAFCAWTFQDARMHAAVNETKLDAQSEKLQAVDKARSIEQAINHKYQEALNASIAREISLRRDRDIARAESDSLRAQSAEAARRLAQAPPSAVLEYATTVNELFAQCSRDRTYFAGQADGHASDVKTLIEAWPALK